MILSISNYHAQGIYILAGGGYGFSAFPEQIAFSYNSLQTINSHTQTSNEVIGSYASGINFNAAIGYNFSKQGYNFSKHIAVEIGVTYISGNTYEANGSWLTNISYPYNTYNYTEKLNANMWRITPAIKIYTEPSVITPYLKAGVVLGIGGTLIVNNDDTYINTDSLNNSTTDVHSRTTKYTKGFSIGLMASLGADYNLNNQFGIYCELRFTGQTWAPEHSEITKMTYNGSDQLKGQTIASTQYNYSNNPSSNSNSDPNQPLQAFKTYYPFSDWGINIGIKYNFGR